jgi:glycosyltransferase involved in cell wall biosynthesis
MKVTQVLCAAGPVDAVTNQGLAWRLVFSRWGWSGADYAAQIAPGVAPRALRPLRDWRPNPGEVVVLHYSGHVNHLEELIGRAPHSLLVSHNVTPAHYFWDHEPLDAARCVLAREQLAALAREVQGLAAVSRFNAEELREMSGRRAAVIPVLVDPGALGPPDREPAGPPTVLFVGRLAPHKRHDLVIRAFAALRRQLPEARLTLVGTAMSPRFEGQLRALAAELAPGAVTFETHGVSRARLAEHYRSAHVFLCLSEHEGFCIPLLEAFHFGVPVVARAAAAVGEVVADAGVLLSEHDDVATIAELLRIVIGDPELRAELRARGQRRLGDFDRAHVEALMRAQLEALTAR